MNIFTPEYVALALAVLVIACHSAKRQKSDDGSAGSSMFGGKRKRLH